MQEIFNEINIPHTEKRPNLYVTFMSVNTCERPLFFCKYKDGEVA